ncbi:hypothetical protein ACF0H5_020227 [Mactra antiquata]
MAFVVYYAQNAWKQREDVFSERRVKYGLDTLNEIKEHSKEFNGKNIIKVTDNIYVALGYALANSIMLIGPEGVVIVDTTESYKAAQEIFAEFRKITNKPVTDIIYTHNHQDHINGAKAFVEDESNPPNVWAHESITKALYLSFKGTTVAGYTRAMRQFGVFLPELSAGIGFGLKFGKSDSVHLEFIYPNKFVEGDRLDVTLAGIPLSIIHIPGETDDQIGVWLPGNKAFLCADDLYRAFPNLYAIRGTKPRALMQWVESMDKMIELEPELLVPSHTRPITKHETVMNILVEYRDAIQYVHDQTVRLINYGYDPDEIANIIRLPKSLEKNPYLREFYGTVKWSSKAVFTENIGWFSGDPVDLDPLTRTEKATKMVDLVGAEKLLQAAKQALDAEDFQWALELSSYVLRKNSENRAAKDIKVEALVALGSRQISLNGRNYYLTSALELSTDLKLTPPPAGKESLIMQYPIDYIMSAFSIRFKPEECVERNETLYLELSEPNSNHFVQLRNGVAIIRTKEPKQFDIKVSCTDSVWRDIILNKRMAVAAIAMGDMVIDGGALALKSFMDCFDSNIYYETR